MEAKKNLLFNNFRIYFNWLIDQPIRYVSYDNLHQQGFFIVIGFNEQLKKGRNIFFFF